ncbi:MAG TPA: hypothetical protein V6C58_25415, partial [Allocoleopsis sp.]
HEIINSNLLTAPYTRTPKLPIRIELSNTGTSASNTSVSLISMAVAQESSAPEVAKYNFSRSNGRTQIDSTNAGIPVLSIQPLANYNGIVNRVTIVPKTIQAVCTNQTILIQVLLNPTLTGASFTSVNANSACAYDVSATAFSGGTIIAEFYVPNANETTFDMSQYTNVAQLANNIAGTAGDILTLVTISVSGNGRTYTAIQWEEV